MSIMLQCWIEAIYRRGGEPGFLVNKQTGDVEKYQYWPNSPIAARLKAMKQTKYFFRKVIIRP